MTKTNAMRALDTAKIPYTPYFYKPDESDLSGIHVAEQIGLPPEFLFKTLIARGEKRGPLVFCLPVNMELNLKKCAVAAGEKRVELIHVKELLPLTGYLRGGCSPIGMKKKFPTWVDESAELYEKIVISAGIRGCQLLLNRKQLLEFIEASLCDLTV